ncbi:hypothetical protein DFR70_101711 [Nocardia tenerifensis]|uniref:Uncharacterized protein n=1 Tax=Nocardia tenerifensis TaxID=228006 RepID=A0A318KEQ1_9NOCA|nr:hypothetical protein [Nocardia tenerifensis]PXX71289.1 hypothetical protein DFR70_101711 [Nocardia tenerifensis]
MRVDWQVYYDAAKKCHELATDLRAADKPVHDAMKSECAGMAGDAPGCKEWGKSFDRASLQTAQTCTNLADALTNFGYVLYATGYNYGISDQGKTSTQPTRPDVRQVPLYKVDFPSSVGDNGNGIKRDHTVGVEAVFNEVADQIASAFGKLPNGDTGKLDKAVSVWSTFANHDTITNAASRISAIIGLFEGADDARSLKYQQNLEAIRSHLGTLRDGASQVATASLSLIGPIKDYSAGTAEVRIDFENAIKSALVALTATLAVAAVTAWFTFGASIAAAGGSAVVIGGQTVRAIQIAYDASKLYRALGWSTAAAAAYVGTMAAFNGAPDLNAVSAALAGIISMKAVIDDDSPDSGGEAGSAAVPNKDVTDEMARMLQQGIHPGEDCSEIAEHLEKVAGGVGEILRVDPPAGKELTVEEYGRSEEFLYHEVYTDGKYVYDPRHSSSPVPIEQWRKTIMGDNPGATIKTVGK